MISILYQIILVIGSYYYNFNLLLFAQYTDDNRLVFGGLFNKFKRNIEDYSESINNLKGLNSLDIFKNGKVDIDAFTKAVGTSDSILIGYTETLKNTDGAVDLTTASTEGLSEYLKKTGQSFNFAAIKATLLNTTLNAGIFLVASLAIQGIAKALDNYIHRIEKARERTSELFDEFKEMNDTLADHKKIVAELADRYDELSKGVNLSTNENVSLSTEEYEEFLDINEQISNSFPELAKGIDENGNSILTLGEKGITAKEHLEDLLQTEEDLNNFRIAQGLDEAFKGVYTYVEEANQATDKLKGSISDSNVAMSKLQDVAENGIKLNGNYNQLIFAGNTNHQAELDYMKSLIDSVNEFWKSLDGNRRVELDGLGTNDLTLFNLNRDENTGAFEIYANAYNLTPEEITALEGIIQDKVSEVSGALLDSIDAQMQESQTKIQQAKNVWTDFIPNLVAGMKSTATFKKLDPDLKDIAVRIVEGLDYSYADAMNEYNPDEPYAYIRDKLIVPMGNLSDSDKELLKSSFEDLFKLDTKNISNRNQDEISKLIDTIATILDKDPLKIRVALGFDVGDALSRYNKALKKAKRQLGGYKLDEHGFEVNNDVGNKLDDFWNENVVTEDDWVLWEKVTKGITDAAKAMDSYAEAKRNANTVKTNESDALSITQTVDQINKQLKPAFDALKAAYQDIFTEDGFTLKNIDLSTLDSIKAKIDELNSLEGVDINMDYASFENLTRVLTDSSSTAEEVHAAINALATDLVSALNPALGKCSGENYKVIQSLLESLGVINSEEVMVSSLGYTYKEYIAAKEEAANAGEDLANMAESEINDFVQEAIESENCGEALALFQLKKQLVNNTPINTAEDIQQIINLASAAGMGADVLTNLATAKSILSSNKNGQAISLNSYEHAQSLIEDAKQAILDWKPVEVDFKPTSTGKSSAKSAGKEVGDTYVDAFEKELKELKELKDAGLLSEKQYLDRFRVNVYALFYRNVE